jgi:hypothetical protein
MKGDKTNKTKTTKSGEFFSPESTIKSANRRDFIKKAALVTASVGVGGALLEKSLSVIPESSADSVGSNSKRMNWYSGIQLLAVRNTANILDWGASSPMTVLTLNNPTETLGNFWLVGFVAFADNFTSNISNFEVNLSYVTESQSGHHYSPNLLTVASPRASMIETFQYYGHLLLPPNSPALTLQFAWTGSLKSPSNVLSNFNLYNFGNPDQVGMGAVNRTGVVSY